MLKHRKDEHAYNKNIKVVKAEHPELASKHLAPKSKLNITLQLHKGIAWGITDFGKMVSATTIIPASSPSVHFAILYLSFENNLVT